MVTGLIEIGAVQLLLPALGASHTKADTTEQISWLLNQLNGEGDRWQHHRCRLIAPLQSIDGLPDYHNLVGYSHGGNVTVCLCWLTGYVLVLQPAHCL